MADEVTVDSKTGADVVSAVTAQRKLAEASGKVAENIAQSFEQISEVFQKTNKAVADLGGTFSKLFGDINSVNDIPLIGTIEDVAMSIDKRLGVAVKALTIAAETLNKIDSSFVDLRRSSVITGAAFGQTSMEVNRYASGQMATLGRLSQTLAVKTDEFNQYQDSLRKMAFSYRDLDTSIQAWGPRRAVVDHMFALSKGLSVEFSTVLKDFEDLTLRAGHATGDFAKNAETTVKIYRGFAYSADRLGVSIPYLREEVMKSVTGHWAAITNIENRATDLRLNYEKFYIQLEKQGQEGLAGDFLSKVQNGLMNLNLGQAAWMTGTGGVGSLAESLTLMAQIRDSSGSGRIQPMLVTVKNVLEKYSRTPIESINQMIARGADLPHLAMQHTFQREQIKSLFKITDEGEAENLMGLINRMFAEGVTEEERTRTSEKIKDIMAQGKGVAQQQLTALQGIAINVKGLFLHYVYGKDASDLLEKNLKTTAEQFEKDHLAKKEAELKRPLTADEKQSALSEARNIWVSLREMVAVGAVAADRSSLEDAIQELLGKGDASYSGAGGTRGGVALGQGGSTPGTLTSAYGERRVVTDAAGRQYSKTHTGVDIAAKEGTVFTAPISGIATYHPEGSAQYGNMGNVVSIVAGNKEHVFAHLLGVPKGFRNGQVSLGDPIGISGSTGRSTGGHIHYEIRDLDATGKAIQAGRGFQHSMPDPFITSSLQASVRQAPRLAPSSYAPKPETPQPTKDIPPSPTPTAMGATAADAPKPTDSSTSQAATHGGTGTTKGKQAPTPIVHVNLTQTQAPNATGQDTGGGPK